MDSSDHSEAPDRCLVIHAQRLVDELTNVLAALRAASPAPATPAVEDELVPLAEARRIWRIEEAAARKRATRGRGVRVDGRWFIPRSRL